MATINAINNITPTLYGSSIANGDITIEGTSNATKTTSYVLLQPSGGKVGIGITTPTNVLHVKGTSGQIRIDDGTTTADFGTSSNLGYIGTITNHDFYIYTNNTEKLRVSALGILTQTTASGASYLVQTNGTVTAYTGIDGSNTYITGTSTTHDWRVVTDNVERIRVTSNGTLTISTNGTLAMSIGTDQAPVFEKIWYMREMSSTPAAGSADTVMGVYMKADKFIIMFNNGGTTRYKYLDLTGTGTTWTHTTSAP